MSNTHGVIDTDVHYKIDGITRTVTNIDETKRMLVQGDHNSERLTFEMPRHFDGHDFSQCNAVQIHFENKGISGANKSSDIYDVDDLHISSEDEEVVILTWLVHGNATKYVGTLDFTIRFACIKDDGSLEYAWNTTTFKGITIEPGIFVSDNIEEEYPDILSQHSARLSALENAEGGNVDLSNYYTKDEAGAIFSSKSSTYQEAYKAAINAIKSEIDPTLTVSSKPADAKSTGDALKSTVKSVNGQTPDENGNVQIPTGGGSAEGAVLYTEQELTTEEQKQARTNIGAMEATYVYDYSGNILPFDSRIKGSYSTAGVTITHENGVFTVNGTTTTQATIHFTTDGTPIEGCDLKAGKYTMCANPIGGEAINADGTNAEGTDASGRKKAALNLFFRYGASNQFQNNAFVANQTVPADYTATRFAFNFSKVGVTYRDYKLAPYVGQNFTDDYAGGKSRPVPPATKEDIDQLDARVTPLEESVAQLKRGAIDYPEMFTEEKNRVIPLATSQSADLRLIAFADSHSTDANKYKKYNELLASGVIDCMVGLGDFNAYSTNTREKTLRHITQSLDYAGRTPDCLYVVGNHDIVFKSANSANVDPDTTLTQKEMHYCTCRHLEGAVNCNEEAPYGCYYYKDYTESKIRMIVLNTSDIYEKDGSLSYKYTESVMIQQPQVGWLVNKALDFSDKITPSEWSVLVFCHSALFIKDLLSKVLSAVKSGSNLNITSTLNNRQQLSDGTKQSVTLNAVKDFSEQGSVNVIGVLYGHDHNDVSETKEGIQFIGFNCDNAELDDYYETNVSNLQYNEKGYYVTASNGKTFCFKLTEEQAASASKIGYNGYLQGNPQTTIRVKNADGLLVKLGWSNSPYVPEPDISIEGKTEITGEFVRERTPGTVEEESCMIVSIDKTAREIRIVPYGVGENRVILY